jgi:hypothetical protein
VGSAAPSGAELAESQVSVYFPHPAEGSTVAETDRDRTEVWACECE